jgi:hypothetical protein
MNIINPVCRYWSSTSIYRLLRKVVAVDELFHLSWAQLVPQPQQRRQQHSMAGDYPVYLLSLFPYEVQLDPKEL